MQVTPNIDIKSKERSSTNSGLGRVFKKITAHQEVGIMIPLIILVGITGIIKPSFFQYTNIAIILRAIAFFTIVAIGESIVIISGEIDISVGGVAGFGSVLAPWFMVRGVPVIPSIAFALVICGVIGLVNGFLVAKVKMSFFIVTIGMSFIARGLVQIVTKGYPVYPLPESFLKFGVAKPLGISWPFIIGISLILVCDRILRYTGFGRRLFAVGDNKNVAQLAGINVAKIKIIAFVISGIMAGFAGTLITSQLAAGTPTVGLGWELQAIAACAVGGISLSGGRGTLLCSLIGVLILAVLTNSLILLGVNIHIRAMSVGFVMVIAVAIDQFKQTRHAMA